MGLLFLSSFPLLVTLLPLLTWSWYSCSYRPAEEGVFLCENREGLTFSRLVCLVTLFSLIGEQSGEETSCREEPLVNREVE